MKTVNLLPGWYLRQRRQERNIKLHVIAMLAIGGLMAGLSLLGRQQVNRLNAEKAQLEARLDMTPNPANDLQRVTIDLKRLQDLQQARQELGNTVPMSCVIQQLQNAMVPGMALTSVAIDVQPLPVKGSGVVGDQRNPPRYHEVAHVVIGGIAVEDRHIAALVRELTNNRLFTDVSQDYIRGGSLQNYSVRKFEIQLSMDLEKLAMQANETTAAEPVASGGNAHVE
ncbi:MAG TPA: hypothetical protein VHM90_16340 [Phycisphaerae bacterium]|jgi:hypothetical protein|nr:hypothetical protein [Phycisphaerae bacterium]